MKNLDAFDKQFPTEDACKVFLVAARWPNGVMCPRCHGKERIYHLQSKPFHWICKNLGCGGRNGYRFSGLSHTIFQDTKIPLIQWFKVGYLMLVAQKGVSALQMHNVIFGEDSGSDYRTTWYMCHRWRAVIQDDVIPFIMEFEVDYTYVGGTDKNRHRKKYVGMPGGTGKVPVIEAIARKGMVITRAIEKSNASTLQGFVKPAEANYNLSLVANDDHAGYRLLK